MLKFGGKNNVNMQNSMVVFTFSLLTVEKPFVTSLVQKIKTVILSWNYVPRLIRICRIRWRFSLFSFLDWYYSNLVKKSKIVSLSLNLIPKLFRICKIRWWCSLCFTPFFVSFFEKFHLAFWCYLINLPAVCPRLLFFLISIKNWKISSQ